MRAAEGEKKRGQRRRPGLGFGWHTARTARFGCASTELGRHGPCEPRLLLVSTKRQDAGTILKRRRAEG